MTANTNNAGPSSDLEARLAALQAKRGSGGSSSRSAAKQTDEDLAARIANLSSTRRGPDTSESIGKARPGKRRHPAQRSRIAALTLSLLTTGGLTAGFGLAGTSGSSIVAQANSNPGAIVPGNRISPSPGTVAPPPSPVTIAGNIFRNRWGDVQVQATFGPDGTIEDVAVLRAPNSNGLSVQINNYAVPILNHEALTAQTASVDTISGATYTSNGYQQSLQSAIDAARAQGVEVVT